MCDLTFTNQKAGKDYYDNAVQDGGSKELPKLGTKSSLDISKRKRLKLNFNCNNTVHFNLFITRFVVARF